MGYRIAIAGFQGSGKSYGRRYIPDGENVMLIAPSVKSSHLFTGPAGVEKFTSQQIDEAINKGTRKMVSEFDISSPEGAKSKYNNLAEALAILPNINERTIGHLLFNLHKNKAADYFGDITTAKKLLRGNIMMCEELGNLKIFIDFVNKFMPWIHTIILPDFTHYISEVLTSSEFINRKKDGEQYAKYLDLAADGLRQFIKGSDSLKKEVIIVTEYHVEYKELEGYYEIFTPGGKMLKEKFLPSSYYDAFLFTDVKFGEGDEGEADYRFVTRKIKKYPEARSIGDFPDLFMPNNLQEVLTRVRAYNNISLK